jgi:hypothetical protein
MTRLFEYACHYTCARELIPMETQMKNSIVIILAIVLFSPVLYSETPSADRSFECRVAGEITVDSLFQALPPARIAIDAAQPTLRQEELDRPNGYLKKSCQDSSGNTITYTAAMYTAGQNNGRIFLMITRDINYIAQFPFTEGFWIFEYSSGRCADVTGTIFPWRNDGSLVKLPRYGTDLQRCARKADAAGLREVCVIYAWNSMDAQFIEMK